MWNDLDVAFSAGISLALAFIVLARLNETSGFFRSEDVFCFASAGFCWALCIGSSAILTDCPGSGGGIN